MTTVTAILSLVGLIYVTVPLFVGLFKHPESTLEQTPIVVYKILNTPLGAVLVLLYVLYHIYDAVTKDSTIPNDKKKLADLYYAASITCVLVLLKMFYI